MLESGDLFDLQLAQKTEGMQNRCYQLQDEFQTGLWQVTLLERIIPSSIPLKTRQR